MRTERVTPSRLLLLAVVAMVGLNLRPFLAAIGPLAASIKEATGLDYQSMSLFTMVPMLLMGICAFAGPLLQRFVGARRAVIGALVVLALGCALRLFTSNGVALIGTAALCGLGVAIVQAVFPGIIKEHFPGRVAVVMGLYSSMLMGGGALGAQLSPIVANAAGNWHMGLAWLAVPAILAAVLAAFALPRNRSQPAGALPLAVLLSRPRTWLLMACFGLVNGGYSSVIAWLAPYYQTLGWSTSASGSLLATMATCQAIAALSIPVLAARSKDRRPWIWLTLSMQVAGFASLALWPEAAPAVSAALVGAGLGGCFALSMVVALDHIEDAANAGALSALMQGGGFLIAAIPPWIVAVLQGLTGSFAAGWLMHLGCALLVAVLALRFAPHGYARAMNIPAAGRQLAYE
ncbi:CP family cyanate transporter-like MFS transporter [Mesorhizobium soli]|jgi:CP family cyanate transporter-like MFS transporter|uniref:cyanate transporter n=1 Tax=Pseudaminobacter soli (ex Li et al. 2025) TaxID=1295366 RepID=UPI002473A0A3|nr:cyanate transporter [Mesorhizobium soli]MDH6231398.1 CP family cyanate transporter-like MFS transporter [Mesorhizobium soli]